MLQQKINKIEIISITPRERERERERSKTFIDERV